MRTNFTLLAFTTIVLLSSCHRYYTSVSFNEKTVAHKTIAILPPQLVVTGSQPKGLSANEVKKLEETESRIFHEYLYNNILKRADSKKLVMNVKVQPYANTLAALLKSDISIRDSWSKTDAELASLLGVDAIVRTSIQKDRYISDLASAGIEIGRKVLDAVLVKQVPLPAIQNKTNDIRATCSIISKGEVLWNDSYTVESNYNYSVNEVVHDITDNFAKHFPYKRKA